jgi:thymidylate kinase
LNLFKNIKQSKVITFSGVDGAGKTTILTEIKNILEEKYNKKVVVIRHRPSILPILSAIKHGKKEAEKKTMEVLPRTGGNSSFISSLVRFTYYLLDYIFGQWILFFRHSLKGDIIIYDRYYFDFINDGRRTNIQLNEKFIKFFYRFVFKPEINIFLYAKSEVILSRKQEMDEKSIVELTAKYKTLFESFSEKNIEKYECIENLDKEKTLQIIENLYIEVV